MGGEPSCSLFTDARRAPNRAELADIRRLALAFVTANERRNPTSENATLGEEDALFNLRWQMNELAKRCNGG